MKILKKKLGLIRSRIIYFWKPNVRKRLNNFYGQFVSEGDLCFDLGAHLGNRSRSFLDLGASVVAVEPQPVCIEFLKKHFGALSRFTLLEEAIGREEGTARLSLNALSPTISTLAGNKWKKLLQSATSQQLHWEEDIEVRLTTLDQLIYDFGLPAFCKIDVEGYEEEVLLGLSQPLQLISFEYFTYTPEMTKRCIQRLEKLGNYRYNWSRGESLKLMEADWIKGNDILEKISEKKMYSGDIYARLVSF
jgi:FkbM family methyltransferase